MFLQNKNILVNRRLFLFFLIIIIFIFCFKIVLSNFIQENISVSESDVILYPSKILPKNQLIKNANLCYNTHFENWKNYSTNFWFELSNIVKDCTKDIIDFIPYIETTPNRPEHKHYMIPRAAWINDSCSVITFGIGGDIGAEEHIKRSLPQCTFIGFDPNSEYKKIFENGLNGKFVEAAVGKNDGNKTTIFQLKQNGYQKSTNIQTKSVAELLEKYHGNENLIDILNIDVEGSEYSIFERLNKDKIFENVCQINFEIHPVWYHSTGYSYYDVIKLLQENAKTERFLWVQNDQYYHQFYAAFFINVENSRCIQKYLKGRLL